MKNYFINEYNYSRGFDFQPERNVIFVISFILNDESSLSDCF